jgi:cell division protein FtsL
MSVPEFLLVGLISAGFAASVFAVLALIVYFVVQAVDVCTAAYVTRKSLRITVPVARARERYSNALRSDW